MLVEITITPSDILTVKDYAPQVLKEFLNKFFNKESESIFKKHGIHVSHSFGIRGITFTLNGTLKEIVESFENEIEMDLKIIIESYTNAVIAFTGAMKTSFDLASKSFDMRKDNKDCGKE